MDKGTFTINKRSTIAILIFFFTVMLSSSVYASMPIGTPIGEVLSTDIIATIDEKPIPSMNINNYTAIVVEDLRTYGFDVIWNEQDRTLKVTRNEMKTRTGKEFTIQRLEPGNFLKPVLFTDIKTYFDGKEIISFNIDGQTAIYFNQLKPYGEIQWNENTRVASFDFPLPVIVAEPTTPEKNDKIVVSRRSTQLDPEDSSFYHQPLDRGSMPEHISVGLFYNDTAVNSMLVRSGNGFNIGTFEDEFDVIFSLADTRQMIIAPDASYYLGLKRSYNTTAEAQEMLQQLMEDKISAFIVRETEGWNVFIGSFDSMRKAEDEIDHLNLDENWTVMGNNRGMIKISDGENKTVLLYDDNSPLYISDASDSIYQSVLQIGNIKYRGALTALSHTDQQLTVINRLPIEQYLYGVVPKEMPATWHSEALKAQAVAARGFALANIGKFNHIGFDVCNTVNSQVYGGYESEKAATTKAVDETYGKVMSANGELVIPYYHSNSGGQTESSEYVWNEEVSYVRGIDDPYSLDAPHAQWQSIITYDELELKLLEKQIDIGRIIDVEIINMSPNGRVLELQITGNDGSHSIFKQESRWVFGLKSNYFSISINNDAVTFNGFGYGHGVGMSQHGARVMAETGFGWQEILAHYFTGIRIE